MDVRKRNCNGRIKIGVIDNLVDTWHMETVKAIILSYVPNAELIITDIFKDGMERTYALGMDF